MITILLAFGLIEICRSSTKWDGIPFWWMNPIFSFSIKWSTTRLNLSNDQLHKTLVRLRQHVNIASYTWANELRLKIAMTTTSTWTTTASQLLTCLQPPKFYLPWSSLPKLLNCEVGSARRHLPLRHPVPRVDLVTVIRAPWGRYSCCQKHIPRRWGELSS